MRQVLASLIFLVSWLGANEAHAYLADAYDARVADHGVLELEIQPLGYYMFDEQGAEHFLVTPSLIAYLGFAEDLDFVLASRGYLRVSEGAQRYHSRESSAYLRWLVREGAYNDATGPSLEIMAGALLPNLEQDGETLGASLGMLLSWTLAGGTIHANLFGNRTAWETWDLFAVVAYEGPIDWTFRPYVEAWLDEDEDYGLAVSGLVGAYCDVSDTATLGAGARYARGDGYSEVEIRASIWFQLPLWDPEETEPE